MRYVSRRVNATRVTYEMPETEFVPDADTTALYHLNEVEGAASIVNIAKEGGAANPMSRCYA